MEGAGGGRGPGWPFCPFSWRRAGGSHPRACVFRWKTQASPVGYLCEEDGEGDGGRCCERACGDNVCGGGEVGGHIAVIAQGADAWRRGGPAGLRGGGVGRCGEGACGTMVGGGGEVGAIMAVTAQGATSWRRRATTDCSGADVG